MINFYDIINYFSIIVFSALCTLPISDDTHERAWHKRGRNCHNERYNAGDRNGDATFGWNVRRSRGKFQSKTPSNIARISYKY